VVVPLVLLAGLVATMVAWRAIARGREVWRTLPPLFAVFGLAALLLAPTIDAPPSGAGTPPAPRTMLVVGLVAGALLYLATRAFVAIAVRVPAFRRHTVEAYREAAAADRGRELILALFLAVPGEELLWRGLAYRWTADRVSSLLVAAVAVWIAYVGANLPSRSLPIVAGAVVGGAVWGALAWWSAGVLAPLASHILWTGAMLGFPPRVADTERDP
jgi:membrane protease YdiL (CAAX protease family)